MVVHMVMTVPSVCLSVHLSVALCNFNKKIHAIMQFSPNDSPKTCGFQRCKDVSEIRRVSLQWNNLYSCPHSGMWETTVCYSVLRPKHSSSKWI